MDSERLPVVAELVDLDRYPIHEPLNAAQISRWREALDNSGVCNLQGFLKPDGARHLAAEAEVLLPSGYQRTFTANFRYAAEASPNLPLGHPEHCFWTTSSTHLASDQFGPESLLKQLYEWSALTRFVAAIQGKHELYRDADEFQALNVIALESGNRTIYHHDHCDCVVTLLLQEPEAGGEFVYRPETRNSNLEFDIDAITEVVEERPDSVRHIERGAGTLTLFRGRHTLHGVLPVEGQRRRVSAVLSYDATPNRIAPDAKNIRLYGPRVESILAERRGA